MRAVRISTVTLLRIMVLDGFTPLLKLFGSRPTPLRRSRKDSSEFTVPFEDDDLWVFSTAMVAQRE